MAGPLGRRTRRRVDTGARVSPARCGDGGAVDDDDASERSHPRRRNAARGRRDRRFREHERHAEYAPRIAVRHERPPLHLPRRVLYTARHRADALSTRVAGSYAGRAGAIDIRAARAADHRGSPPRSAVRHGTSARLVGPSRRVRHRVAHAAIPIVQPGPSSYRWWSRRPAIDPRLQRNRLNGCAVPGLHVPAAASHGPTTWATTHNHQELPCCRTSSHAASSSYSRS